jgi:CheY-like chemotaxis protein
VPLIALTGNPGSRLARDATVHIDVSVEREACPLGLAPTNDAGDVVRPPDLAADVAVDLSGLRVLAADDNRTNRMILGAMLGQLGVSAVTVSDGQSALHCFDGQPFDVVILDISMPDLDGVAVMHEMRRRLALRRGGAAGRCPRMLAFTANAMSHQVEAYLQAGFDDCLTKPLQLQRLADALVEGLCDGDDDSVARKRVVRAI